MPNHTLFNLFSLYDNAALGAIFHLFNNELCSNRIPGLKAILLDKYKTENNATNPLPDSISIEEAKSIFALNIISVQHDRKIKKERLIQYQMTIVENEQTTTLTNNTELLSEEMILRLSKITSGSKIYFEGILAGDSETESAHVIILYFVVI